MGAFRYRILVVEDDANLATMAKAILESQGYEVHCATDGFDGLTALKQSPLDVIISDLQMPRWTDKKGVPVVVRGACFPHYRDRESTRIERTCLAY
jgi:CheY-like chemotaxis protein